MSKRERLYTINRSIRWVVRGLFSLFLLTLVAMDVSAQVRPLQREQNDTVPFKDRVSIRTNMVDWVLMQPNIGFEFDLIGRDYSKWTIGGDVKGNWTTSNTYKTPAVFDVFGATLEVKRYYRTRKVDVKNETFFERIKRMFSARRKKSHANKVFYWGGYASYGSYALKLGSEGKKGEYYSAGGSIGWGTSLYSYKSGANIDLEIGGRVGILFTRYDVFRYDRESDCYPIIPEKGKPLHVKPYPVPVDIHVSLVYRFKSIKQKYSRPNFVRQHKMEELDAARKKKQARLSEIKDSLKNIKGSIKDSIKSKVFAKRDSLLQADTTGMTKKQLKERERLLKIEEKKAEKLSKAANKKDKSKKEKAPKEKKPKKEKAPKEKKPKKEKAPKKGKKEQASQPADAGKQEGGES